MKYLVRQQNEYIVAPAGRFRKSNGTGYGKDKSKSPEMGPRKWAYVFNSKRSASYQLNKLGSKATIVEVNF